MEDKKSFKVDGGIEISEEALQKIRKDAVNDFKKEMIRTTIKKEFECFVLNSWHRGVLLNFVWSALRISVFVFI